MANAVPVIVRSRWLLLLFIVAILSGLAAHLISDATLGSPDLVKAGQRADVCNSANAQPGTCRLLANSALPAIAGVAWLQLVVFLLNDPGLERPAWASLPPVRPPILSHDI